MAEPLEQYRNFVYIFVAVLNKRIIPLASTIDHTDALAEAEFMVTEKCFLYVDLTRAQKRTYVIGYGTPLGFNE